ncbi:MAG: hypothetical protein ABMA01_13460 [Chthoniobacteraceae bacterium]
MSSTSQISPVSRMRNRVPLGQRDQSVAALCTGPHRSEVPSVVWQPWRMWSLSLCVEAVVRTRWNCVRAMGFS